MFILILIIDYYKEIWIRFYQRINFDWNYIINEAYFKRSKMGWSIIYGNFLELSVYINCINGNGRVFHFNPCTLLQPSQTQNINIKIFNFFLILWRHKIDIMTLRKYVNWAQTMQCLNSYHNKRNLNFNFPKKINGFKTVVYFFVIIWQFH